jgi:hypothetical protein
VRVYLPATLPLLVQWLAAGEATPVGPAYAVTPALREWYFEAEIDELEHAAQAAASSAVLRLIAADPDAPCRRFVIAADVADAAVHPDPESGRAAIRVAGPVPVAVWGSALVDAEDAADAVRSAAGSIGAADRGDGDAQFDVDEAGAHELGWYGVQELRYLVGES